MDGKAAGQQPGVVDADPARGRSAARRSAPHLDALRAVRERLSEPEQLALKRIEVGERIGLAHPKNRSFVTIQNREFLDADMHKVLDRTASFMLARPICIDLRLFLEKHADDLKAPASIESRMLLTAQVAQLRQIVDDVGGAAIRAARNGERCCPLVLQEAQFHAFLLAQKPAIDAVISACELAGPERRPVLERALHAFSNAYLSHAQVLPPGLDAGNVRKMPKYTLDHKPVTLVLAETEQSCSYLEAEWAGCVAAIVIGIDDLDAPDRDPSKGSGTTRLHAKGFEQCRIAQKQTGTYLQKLLVELINMEERSYIEKHRNKEGTPMAGPSAGTDAELSYRGSALLGDSVSDVTVEGFAGLSRSQRAQTFDALDAVAAASSRHAHFQNEKLLLDEELHAWLHSPSYCKDIMILHSPAARLQLAAMDITAAALMSSGLLD